MAKKEFGFVYTRGPLNGLWRYLFLFIISLNSFYMYSQVKIEMKKKGSLYEVPCEVNGLKLNFYFDTGASLVSLSSSVADFMLKHDYINKEDIYDEITLGQADGSTYKSNKVKIRTLNIGGFILHDVTGVITPHQDAPLLLGQSAIQKLGKISIKDNYLIIEKRENINYTGIEKDISFLGLKQGAFYDDCYDLLVEKYGEDNVGSGTTNGVDVIEVDNMLFNHIIFDEIVLYFDDNYLNSVDLVIHYSKKDVTKITKKIDEIYKIYAKKYTAIRKSTRNGYADYAMGYEKRIKDFLKYPISLGVVQNNVRTLVENKWEINDYYDVVLTYWPASQKQLFDNNPPNQDEY